MRRVLLPWWPRLMHFYGVKPWDVDRFTDLELAEMINQFPQPPKEGSE